MKKMKDICVSRSMVHFQMKLVKILGNYLRLKTSYFAINFFKDYLKPIKEICKTSWNESKYFFDVSIILKFGKDLFKM